MDCTRLFPEGKGRHLTNDGFIKELERSKQEKKEGQVNKVKPKEERAKMQSVKAVIESQWQGTLAKHKEAVEKWEMECEGFVARREMKKNWPKRPMRPLKPKGTSRNATASSSAMMVEDQTRVRNEAGEESDLAESGDEFEG
ncbi:hypothetical protein BS17DRAFT_845374 [Gyrodon lividus]|nr:hypothetical protein BS17DRAFT_845374 [Gyrodon lividus]